jgi:hypothetical protein
LKGTTNSNGNNISHAGGIKTPSLNGIKPALNNQKTSKMGLNNSSKVY